MCSLLTREAHITAEGYITHEVHISFRASGTHRSKQKSTVLAVLFCLEVTIGFEPMDNGVADRGLTTWLRHQTYGADYGARTRHLDLGKVALYQMS